MKPILRIAALVLVFISVTFIARAQVTDKKTLSIEGAKKVIAASVAYAKKNNAPRRCDCSR